MRLRSLNWPLINFKAIPSEFPSSTKFWLFNRLTVRKAPKLAVKAGVSINIDSPTLFEVLHSEMVLSSDRTINFFDLGMYVILTMALKCCLSIVGFK